LVAFRVGAAFLACFVVVAFRVVVAFVAFLVVVAFLVAGAAFLVAGAAFPGAARFVGAVFRVEAAFFAAASWAAGSRVMTLRARRPAVLPTAVVPPTCEVGRDRPGCRATLATRLRSPGSTGAVR
jgi:hypothetical protein